jgi:L-serine dehydratase
MHISVFELFTIGIGPSSSHTVGPMRAAARFVEELAAKGTLGQVARVEAVLFGSLGLTGKGHGSDKAVFLGLEGEHPESVELGTIEPRLAESRARSVIHLAGSRQIPFDWKRDLVFNRRETMPGHPNGMRFSAFAADGSPICMEEWYSIGGGFIVPAADIQKTAAAPADGNQAPYPFDTAVELLDHCNQSGLRVCEVMRANEEFHRPAAEISGYLQNVWLAMRECVERGWYAEGELPGGLRVRRRAAELRRRLLENPESGIRDPLSVMDWVSLYAIAVNEENAAGGRVVTAPTNGAAGIIPAVLHYAHRFHPERAPRQIEDFLLTAAAIGSLYKKNASISGADVGCQGEVGVACSMAAGALAEYLGGTPAQVENAAEIGMEHNLGLTCDPIGGLVQIPCIERNAMGAVKAINAARMALRGDGTHFVSLDKVIHTMWTTGRDMSRKYKETARGGLAVNVVEC